MVVQRDADAASKGSGASDATHKDKLKLLYECSEVRAMAGVEDLVEVCLVPTT